MERPDSSLFDAGSKRGGEEQAEGGGCCGGGRDVKRRRGFVPGGRGKRGWGVSH